MSQLFINNKLENRLETISSRTYLCCKVKISNWISEIQFAFKRISETTKVEVVYAITVTHRQCYLLFQF